MQSYMSFNFVFLQLASADYTPLVNEAVNLPIGTALGSQFCTTINILPDASTRDPGKLFSSAHKQFSIRDC